MMLEDYLAGNRALWDYLVAIHARADSYGLERFRAGYSSLHHIEREEVGDVQGKSLLHLQCHFGLDSLSWSRLGARVTGVDFSPEGISLARSLCSEQGLDANFICSDIYDLPTCLDQRFDIVFTSYGVLCWLPDLPRWGRLVAHYLKPGGLFYIIEGHPLLNIFANEPEELGLRVAYSYFHEEQPTVWAPGGDYASQEQVPLPSFEWTHSLGDVINALLGAGLRLDFLHEFPFCMYRHFSFLVEGEDGYWHMPPSLPPIPMLFSLGATKEDPQETGAEFRKEPQKQV